MHSRLKLCHSVGNAGAGMAGGGTVGCDKFGSDTFSGETVVGDNEVGGNDVLGNVVNAAAVGAVVGRTVIGVAMIGGGTLIAGAVVVKGAEPAGKASGCGNGGAREDDEAAVCGAIGGRPLIGSAVGGNAVGGRPVVGNAVGVGSTGASEIGGRRLETLSSLAVDVAASLGGGDTGCAVGWIGGNGINAVQLNCQLDYRSQNSAAGALPCDRRLWIAKYAAMPNGTSRRKHHDDRQPFSRAIAPTAD